MGLEWDISKISDYKSVCFVSIDGGEPTLRPVTESILYLAHHIGMDKITKKNWVEFAVRCKILEVFGKTLLTQEISDPNNPENVRTVGRNPGPMEIYAHVGLTTNVETITSAKFKRNVVDGLFDAVKAEIGKISERLSPTGEFVSSGKIDLS